MDDRSQVHGASVELGELVYDSDNRPVGRVSGLTDDGFEAEEMDPDENEAEEMDPDENEVEELPGQEFGEGYLMWRCGECGEMGELDEGIPESCPNCSAPQEAISPVEED